MHTWAGVHIAALVASAGGAGCVRTPAAAAGEGSSFWDEKLGAGTVEKLGLKRIDGFIVSREVAFSEGLVRHSRTEAVAVAKGIVRAVAGCAGTRPTGEEEEAWRRSLDSEPADAGSERPNRKRREVQDPRIFCPEEEEIKGSAEQRGPCSEEGSEVPERSGGLPEVAAELPPDVKRRIESNREWALEKRRKRLEEREPQGEVAEPVPLGSSTETVVVKELFVEDEVSKLLNTVEVRERIERNRAAALKRRVLKARKAEAKAKDQGTLRAALDDPALVSNLQGQLHDLLWDAP